MSIKEQNEIKQKYYTEAIRYMDNALETLKKAGKEDLYYKDEKYVKTACGTAYNSVLKALDGYFILKQLPGNKKGSRKDRQYYEERITSIDKKLLRYFETVYRLIHLEGYYEGETNVKAISTGLECAYLIINRIKPVA
jgi:hypothetical protein